MSHKTQTETDGQWANHTSGQFFCLIITFFLQGDNNKRIRKCSKRKNPLAFSQKESGPMVQGFTFENCGKSSDPIKVTKLQLGPDPVKIPGNISLAVNASTSKVLAAPIKVIESNLFNKIEPRNSFLWETCTI